MEKILYDNNLILNLINYFSNIKKINTVLIEGIIDIDKIKSEEYRKLLKNIFNYAKINESNKSINIFKLKNIDLENIVYTNSILNNMIIYDMKYNSFILNKIVIISSNCFISCYSLKANPYIISLVYVEDKDSINKLIVNSII